MINFWLQLSNGTFEFNARYISLGRDPMSSFVLPDPSVLPFHACLVEKNDRLFLEKIEFDALTFVNRAPIHQRAEILDGDVIDIGPYTLMVRAPSLERRQEPLFTLNEVAYTPSDVTIVRTVRLSETAEAYAKRNPDESTNSFII